MAANNYFREFALDSFPQYQPEHQPDRNNLNKIRVPQTTYTPYSSSSSPYTPGTPSPAYQSTENLPKPDSSRYQGYSSHSHKKTISDDPFADSYPLKPSHDRKSSSRDGRSNQHSKFNELPEPPYAPTLVPRPGRAKRDGFFTSRIPWVVFITSLIQVSVFIGEIIQNSIVTGSPIMIHPQFNPMIGPSTYVIINMGARFVPCMRTTPGVQDSITPITWPCPNTTTSDPNAASNQCDLKALCGFAGVNDAAPNQWFRFIIPMFLHAGVIHIGFNMLLQLTMGREMELAIGSIRFALVYFSSGIFGFVLGGNFAATAIASTGASGCLFGILALTLLDLLYCWNQRKSPVRDLMWILVDVLISFVLGLLPGLDNFSHIGGFLMGLVAGICILHSPDVLRQRIDDPLDKSPYQAMDEPDRKAGCGSSSTAAPANVSAFTKEPVGFFKGRKPLWWAWWGLRAGALIGVLVCFIVLLNNFFKYRDTCSWCKYLSCLPINNWCNIGNLQLTNATTTNNGKRDLLSSMPVLVEDLLRIY